MWGKTRRLPQNTAAFAKSGGFLSIQLLCVYDEAVFTAVGAGGKGDNIIIRAYLHACVILGRRCDFFQEGSVSIVRRKTDRICDIGHGSYMTGKDLIAVGAVL